MKSSLPISQRRNSRDLRYYGMENSSHKRRVFFGDLTLKKVVEHICGHFVHIYSITVNQVMEATGKLSK
jgi:hypothetical protein